MTSEIDAMVAEAPATDLDDEARYLYRRLLGGEASVVLLGHYRRAHRDLSELRNINLAQRRTLALIVSHQLDATGIEPWLRGNSPHALGIKLRLLSYLGECGAHPRFHRRAVGLLEVWGALGLITANALFSLLRGYLQKLKYGLL